MKFIGSKSKIAKYIIPIWEQEVTINAHQTKQKKAIERLYKVK